MGKNELIGSFEQLVMWAVLRVRDEAYGVRIQDEIEQCTGRQISAGAVYVTLARLEDRGFVSSKLGEATAIRGGRRKRNFALTPAGLHALDEATRALEAVRAGVQVPGEVHS